MKLFNKNNKQNKETSHLPMSKKSKRAFAVYAALVLMFGSLLPRLLPPAIL